MRKLLISFLFLLYSGFCCADVPIVLDIGGHQSVEKVQRIKDKLDSYSGSDIVVRVDSWSGELKPVLALAKELHALKASRGAKITVYIENRAVGPSAVFPFLADAWLGTDLFVWGDVIYGLQVIGDQENIPQEELIAQIIDLISSDSPNAAILKMLARSMVDPKVELVDEGGWQLAAANGPKDPQVVNRSQLADMGFMITTMHSPDFVQKYGVAEVGVIPIDFATSTANEQLSEHIHYRTNGSNLIGYLYMTRDRPIDQSTYLHVKFALDEYRKKGVRFVILRLNTPGGEVFPAMKIAELLQEFDAQYKIPVIALINNWALSAGAMLAYSCRFIAVTNTALMGAAEPVMAGPEGKMETAPEKMISALRAEFGSLAKYYGRNPLIAEAMVDKDMILVKRQGEIIQLSDESQIRTTGEDADELITPRGKLLTLDAEQLIRLDVAEIMLPVAATRRVSNLAEEVGEWPASQSQLFTYPFFANIPYATIIYYHDWKIDFFSFLTHPLVASLLMMGLIIGVYIEISHPGLGAPGIMALTCLGLILLSNFATEAINWLEILIIAAGVLLVLCEIFILPGFGILGIIGTALVLFGIFAMLLPGFENVQFSWNLKDWNLEMFNLFDRFAWDAGALVLSLLCIMLLARYVMPKLMHKSSLVLHADQEGSVAGPEKKTLPPIGTFGEAFTSLRPGGKVVIEHRLYDALSEGNFIERGDKVVVIKIQGSAIIVAKR